MGQFYAIQEYRTNVIYEKCQSKCFQETKVLKSKSSLRFFSWKFLIYDNPKIYDTFTYKLNEVAKRLSCIVFRGKKKIVSPFYVCAHTRYPREALGAFNQYNNSRTAKKILKLSRFCNPGTKTLPDLSFLRIKLT